VPQGDLVAEADAMHTQLVCRADELVGCTDGSPEAAELAAITDVLENYEIKRWPLGKIPGGALLQHAPHSDEEWEKGIGISLR